MLKTNIYVKRYKYIYEQCKRYICYNEVGLVERELMDKYSWL